VKRVTALLAILVGIPAHAQETQITILGVLLPGSDATVAQMYLDNVANSGYFTNQPVGVTVRISNWGLPVPMPSPMTSTGVGSASVQLANALADLTTHNFRNDADLVLFFAPDISGGDEGTIVCGQAQQRNWTALGGQPQGLRWNPTPVLDLHGSEDSFFAVVSTHSACASVPINAIHELGHLFGAGHSTPPAPVDGYLLPDSHAALYTIVLPFGPPLPKKTIMGQANQPGAYNPAWSAPGGYIYFSIPAQSNNFGTVKKTAVSVANYRTAPSPPPLPPGMPPKPPVLPPGCALQTPTGFTASLSGVCVGNPPVSTSYNVFWYDQCPGAKAYYSLEHSQPVGAPYVPTPGGSTLFPWGGVIIEGADGLIRVRACDAIGCSSPSNSALLHDQC
jgi:hypothetical protein